MKENQRPFPESTVTGSGTAKEQPYTITDRGPRDPLKRKKIFFH